MTTTTMTVRIPSALAKRLARLAKATERNKSWLTVDAVRHYLDIHEWQVAQIEAGIKEADEGKFASDEQVESVRKKWKRHAR